MLIVRPIGPSVASYYLRGPDPGRWAGDGARYLGLAGPPSASTFAPVLRGEHPVHGNQLGRGHPWRRAGWDLVFAAPKSVSLVAALASVDDGAAMRAAHVRAVAETMEWMADQACWSWRKAGQVAARDLVWASFEHSRSAAGDPHLHTHVVLANVVRAPDGQWSALSSSELWRSRRSLGALYDLGLRHQLGLAGLPFAWTLEPDRPADITGIPRAAIEAASIRTKQLQSSLPAGVSATSARQREVARARTRPTAPDLTWTERLEAVGFGKAEVAVVIDEAKARPAAGAPHQRNEAAYRWLTDHASAWNRSDALRALGATLETGAAPPEAMARVDDLCRGALSVGRDRWTTGEAQALDERIGVLAAEPATRAVVTEQTARLVLEHRPQLSEAQRADVRRLLFGNRAAEVVAGTPGELDVVAQAMVIDGARAAWQASGYRVVVDTSEAAAARWRALTGLQASPSPGRLGPVAESSPGAESSPVAGSSPVTGRWSGQREPIPRSQSAADVVVIDRADRRSSRELVTILSDARRAGAKVVLVQGGSIPAQAHPRCAALADQLHDRARDVRRAELPAKPESLRWQHPPWQRSDRLPASVGRSGLVVCGSLPDAVEELLDRWLASSPPARPLLVGLGPAEVDTLNRAARSRLLSLGLLDGDQHSVNGQHFSPGDQVVARRTGAVPAGSLGTVVSITSRPVGLGVAWAETVAPRTTVLSSADARRIAHGYAVGPTLAAKIGKPLLVLGDPRLAGVLRTTKSHGHDVVGVVVASATMRRSPTPDRLVALAQDELRRDRSEQQAIRGHWRLDAGRWSTVDPALLSLPELADAHASLGRQLRASLPPDASGDRRRLEEDRSWLLHRNARHGTEPEQWAQLERREALVATNEVAMDEWRQSHGADLRRWALLDDAMVRRGDLLAYAAASDPRSPTRQLLGDEPPDALGSDIWWRAVRAAAMHQERSAGPDRDPLPAQPLRLVGGGLNADRSPALEGREASLSRRQRDRAIDDLRRYRDTGRDIDGDGGLSR